jgi:hypothetical protein
MDRMTALQKLNSKDAAVEVHLKSTSGGKVFSLYVFNGGLQEID